MYSEVGYMPIKPDCLGQWLQDGVFGLACRWTHNPSNMDPYSLRTDGKGMSVTAEAAD